MQPFPFRARLVRSVTIFCGFVLLASARTLGQTSPLDATGTDFAPLANPNPSWQETGGPKPNRTLPKFDLPNGLPRFSTPPTDQQILEAGMFDEALIPSSPYTAACSKENKALAEALLEYRRLGGGSQLEPLRRFLEEHPQTRWRPALLVNLGLQYFWHGYFSRSLEAWEESWNLLKAAAEPNLHALADRAAAEFAELNARFGRYERLKQLLQEVQGREFYGAAAEKMSRAREGVWMMQHQPGDSFRCGPLALHKVRAALRLTNALHIRIKESDSGPLGFSLRQVHQLALETGMRATMARRPRGTPLALPCVVHWKVGHFGALIQREGERYLLQDSTFAHPLWLQADAIEEESSGYFLLTSDTLPPGWTGVSADEAGQIWGKGVAGVGNPEGPKCPRRSGPSSRCCGAGPGGVGPPPGLGLADYFLNHLEISYGIVDTPLFYRPPRGPSISFTVTYNSRDEAQPANFSYGNLGRGWTFEWLSYVVTNTASPRVYLPGAGVETHANGAPHRLTQAELVHIGSAHFERRLSNGSKYVYDLPGPGGRVFMTRVVDPAGNAVRLHFDAGYRIRAITDAIGQVTTLDYLHPTDTNKISRITDPFGRAATLEYNESGLLRQVTDVAGMVSEFLGSNSITAFRTPYGTNRFLAGEILDSFPGRPGLPATNLAVFRWLEVIDPLNNRERLEFAGQNVHSPQDVPLEAHPGNVEGDPSNYLRRNTYYYGKRAMALGAPIESAHLWHWAHDADNRFVSYIAEWEKPPLQNRIWYNYDNGNYTQDGVQLALPTVVGRNLARVGVTTPAQIWRYTYNPIGHLTSETDPAGRIRRYSYSPDGVDLLSIQQLGPTGYQTLGRFDYNDQHRVIASVDAAGQTNLFTYNAHGQLSARANPKGEWTRHEYDSDGYLRRIVGPVPGATAEFTFDDYGRVRTVTDSDGHTVTHDYDALNRPTKTSYPDGTFEMIVYDRLEAALTRDRLGQWTHTTHNALGQPTLIVDPLGRTNRLDWCGCGTLERITDPLGRATTWSYDAAGRPVAKTYADGSREQIEFEPEVGRLRRKLDARGQVIEFRYHRDNTLTNIAYLNAVVPTPSVSLAYDPYFQRLLRMVDGIGTNNFSYHPISSPPGLGAGQLHQVDGPWPNDTVTYDYDELGRIVNRSIAGADYRWRYDALGRIVETTNVLGTFRYEYVGATARPGAIRYPNGVDIRYEYFDDVGDHRLKSIQNTGPAGLLSRFDYTYDALGRVRTWVQQANTTPAQVWALDYDRASQLAGVSVHQDQVGGPIVKEYAYTYDSAGNRLSEQIDASVSSASYNNLNQLIATFAGGPMRVRGTVSEPSLVTVNGHPASLRPDGSFAATVSASAGTNALVIVAEDGNSNRRTNRYTVVVTNALPTQFAFDRNGNTLMISNAATLTTYQWDAQDRLAAIQQGTNRSEFKYDGFGRRARLLEWQGMTLVSDQRFLWCGSEICEARDASNARTHFFRRGKQAANGRRYFYGLDHLETPRDATDETGTLQAQFAFDPYGRRERRAGTVGVEAGFTSHHLHEPSGLHLPYFRAYAAEWGRWLSRDPLGEIDGLNIYTYVRNRPATLVDSLGLQSAKDPRKTICEICEDGENACDPKHAGAGPIAWFAYVGTCNAEWVCQNCDWLGNDDGLEGLAGGVSALVDYCLDSLFSSSTPPPEPKRPSIWTDRSVECTKRCEKLDCINNCLGD